MPKWESVTNDMPYVSRLPVPGGWIYRLNYTSSTTEIVFVPDPVYQDDTTYDRGYEAGARDSGAADDKSALLESALARLVVVADKLIPAGGSNAELADAEEAIMAAYGALGKNPTQSPIST